MTHKRTMWWIVVGVLFGTLVAVVAPADAAEREWPVYRRGAQDPDVRAAQLLLRSRGFDLGTDGRFRATTEDAVERFQRRRDLEVDGVIGNRTWSALIRTLRRGDRGAAVRALQVQLRNNRFDIAVDGIFGRATERAVRAAQRSGGLAVDGIVGPITWHDLVRRIYD